MNERETFLRMLDRAKVKYMDHKDLREFDHDDSELHCPGAATMIHVCGEETVDSSDSFWHFDDQGQLIRVKHL
jgi:hypothetical protein